MADHAMTPGGEAAHHSHAARYAAVWIALLALTLGTWGASRIEFHGALHLTVALVIAAAKGALVVLFFMHLYDQAGANRMVFVTSLVFVALLIVLTLTDYATRFALTRPPGTVGAIAAPDYAPPPNETTR